MRALVLISHYRRNNGLACIAGDLCNTTWNFGGKATWEEMCMEQ